MKVSSSVNKSKMKEINKNAITCLIKTGDALKSDLIRSQTMPFDTGNLQNRSTFLDTSESNMGIVKIVNDTKYARRLYYHPEYKFSKKNNPNAGGMWFEPYLTGNKRDFVKNTFEAFMKGQL